MPVLTNGSAFVVTILVKGALYGLVESPGDWAVYRDATCKTISWKGETGQHRRLAPTPEPHVWSIEEMEKTSNGEKWFVIGNMGVYVDDLLLVAPNNILEETLGALEERFALATPEWVTGAKTVTFCGYEISKTDQGYALGQEKYIGDLIDKHNIKQTAGIPCPNGPEEPSENLTGPVLRAAQQLCGELMWLTTRTRPDVAYTVGGNVSNARVRIVVQFCCQFFGIILHYRIDQKKIKEVYVYVV